VYREIEKQLHDLIYHIISLNDVSLNIQKGDKLGVVHEVSRVEFGPDGLYLVRVFREIIGRLDSIQLTLITLNEISLNVCRLCCWYKTL
jgi:hypothetical protein